jgi:hypothetical protein
MQTNNRENQNEQIPSEQGRAAEATASLNNLLNSFFENTSFDDSEDILCDLVQMYIYPDQDSLPTRSHLSNVIYGVRNIINLLRKLEAANDQLKGGASC